MILNQILTSPHLLVIQSSLHRRPVLHLLGQPAITGTGQMLLLHGGSNAYRSGLLVLQHVSEASELGGKEEGGSKRRGQGIYRGGGGSRVPHQVISHIMDAATQIVVALLSFKTHVPLVGTHFLSQSRQFRMIYN